MLLNINDSSCQGRVNSSSAYLTFKPTAILSHWVQEFWQLNVSDGRYFYRSVPDNCVDMIFNVKCPEDAFIVTPFSTVKVFEMTGPVSYFGIRFRILGHQGIVTAPLGEWNNADNVISLCDILPENLLNALYTNIYNATSFQKRCVNISQTLLSALSPSEIDGRLLQYILYCDRSLASTIDISNKKCAEFGVSARHLRRLTSQYLGLSPREFAKVFRFQQTLSAMNNKDSSNAWTRYYYDQSHFNRDFKVMSGLTPNEFRTMSALYNTD